MWSKEDPSTYFIDHRRLAKLPKSVKSPFMWMLYFVCLFPCMTAVFTKVFPIGLHGVGQYTLLLTAFLLSVAFCPFVRLLRLDKRNKIARNHGLFVLIVSVVFILPVAASIKSVFATVINPETGEYKPYFDYLFLLLVYAPIHYCCLGFVYAVYLKPLMLAQYLNYAEVISKEGVVFLNYWNWGSKRKRMPSVDDYDVKGRVRNGPIRPLCSYVVEEDALSSMDDNKSRKKIAICSSLSLVFSLLSGLWPVIAGFGFDDVVGILFFVVFLINYALFVSFSAELIWLDHKWRVFKNTGALWACLIMGALIAPAFVIVEYFSGGGRFTIHPVDLVALLFYAVVLICYVLLVYSAYLGAFFRHYGKRD